MSASQSYADLKRDKNNQVLHVARSMRTCDGTTPTPKTSPLTVDGTIQEIVFPRQAVELVILDTDGALRVSEDSTMTSYAVIPQFGGLAVQQSDAGSIYLQSDGGGSITVQFYFHSL